MADGDPTCPRCGAPRADALECPHCGVIYARAKSRPLAEPPTAIAAAAPVEGPGATLLDKVDARLEVNIRLFAIPVALVLAKIVMASSYFHSLGRVFLSMWVHELGHAATAWWCGFLAVPGPWITIIPEERSPLTPILVAAAIIWLAYKGWCRRKMSWILAAVVLAVAQVHGTLLITPDTARMLITFGGDAGCFVIGTVLMASMYADVDSQIHRGWLRWGFLVIGATAFVDVFDTWWAAHNDLAEIPLGENEGVGPSDASVLVDQYRWDPAELVRRYLRLGAACALALGVMYVYGWRVAKARAAQLEGR